VEGDERRAHWLELEAYLEQRQGGESHPIHLPGLRRRRPADRGPVTPDSPTAAVHEQYLAALPVRRPG